MDQPIHPRNRDLNLNDERRLWPVGTMALFQSDKRYVLTRLRRHDWRSQAELQDLLERLQELDLKLPDLLWMVTDSEPVLQAYGAQLMIQGQFPQAGTTVLREALEASGPARSGLLALLPRLRDDEAILGRLAEWLEGKEGLSDPRAALATEGILSFPPARTGSLLGRLMQSDSAEVRWKTLGRLIEDCGTQGPEARTRSLLMRCCRDPDERLRVRALQTLSRFADAAFVAFIIERLPVESSVVQQVIRRALAELIDVEGLGVEDRLVPLLGEGDPAVRDAVIEIVQRMQNPGRAIRRILEYSKELSGWMRDRLQKAVAALGPMLVSPMIELMESADPALRSAALSFVSQFNDPRLVPAVIPLVREQDWWTQLLAIETLGRLKDERAVDVLVECLREEELRWSAVEALAQVGTPRALRPVAALLAHENADVRMEVIRALELAQEVRALPALRNLAEGDPVLQVRERAARAFRAIQERHAQAGTAQPELKVDFQAGRAPLRRLDALLAETRRVGSSDLHLTPGAPPYVRLNGELRRVGTRVYSEAETRAMILEVLDAEQRHQFSTNNQVDFCYEVAGVGRYRANVYEQRKGATGVFRVIPDGIPSFAELRLPQAVAEVTSYNQGLVLVCGTAGSGKTTTLNCLIDLLNQSRPDHILTLEDPIEFKHPYKSSLVNQRQVGRDTQSFERALRAALREDPDVIVVGDLRDLESIRLTVTAAETGHLVLATLSTSSAAKSVSRLIDAFPPREQGHVRSMLAESLKLVLGQTLVPRKDQRGRVAAFELLVVTPAVSNLIREKKTHLLPAVMQLSRAVGMRTMDHSLKELLEGGLISPETAWLQAEQKEDFESLVPRSFLEGSYASEH